MTSQAVHFPVSGLGDRARARGACPFGSEMPGGVQGGVQRIATDLALKRALSRAVLPDGMSTPGALLARMPGLFFSITQEGLRDKTVALRTTFVSPAS